MASSAHGSPLSAPTMAAGYAPPSSTSAATSPQAQQQQQQPPVASVMTAAGDAVASEIPIRLTLGGAMLSIGASGQWGLEHSSLQEYAERTRVLQERNALLEKENAQLRDKCLRMTEESNMEKFKCQLLVEMLALSSLDEEKSKSEAEQERAKAANMQNDMLALLDQARKEGLDVRKLATVLTSPTSNRP